MKNQLRIILPESCRSVSEQNVYSFIGMLQQCNVQHNMSRLIKFVEEQGTAVIRLIDPLLQDQETAKVQELVLACCNRLYKKKNLELFPNLKGHVSILETKMQVRYKQSSEFDKAYCKQVEYSGKMSALQREAMAHLLISNSNIKSLPRLFSQIVKINEKQLCCRPYFIHGQDITTSTRLDRDQLIQSNNKQSIVEVCMLLNARGGIILYGIQHNIVSGCILHSSDMEEHTKVIRRKMQQVEPVATCRIDYVPVRDNNMKYIPGRYVIRMHVKRQKSRYLYYIRPDEVYIERRLTPEEVYDEIRRRANVDYRHPRSSMHDGDCEPPDTGLPIYDEGKKVYIVENVSNAHLDEIRRNYKNVQPININRSMHIAITTDMEYNAVKDEMMDMFKKNVLNASMKVRAEIKSEMVPVGATLHQNIVTFMSRIEAAEFLLRMRDMNIKAIFIK